MCHILSRILPEWKICYYQAMALNLHLGFLSSHKVASDSPPSPKFPEDDPTGLDALRLQNSQLIIALSQIEEGVIAVDPTRKIIIFNKAAENITGIASSFAVGKPIYQVLKFFDGESEVTSMTYCPIKQANSLEDSFIKSNLKLSSANSKQTYVNLVSREVVGGSKYNISCVLTFSDATQESQLEKMKLDFVTMAAHELRTPITSIKGYLEVLQQEGEKTLSAEQKTFLIRINISTQQLMSLVENLLNVSRIERGAFSVSREQVDWLNLVRQVISDFGVRAKDKRISLEFLGVSSAGKLLEAQSTPISIRADKLRVTEVLSNLIANALNYTQAGGSVKIWVESNNQEVVTYIQDTGQGIPQEAIPHLFTKFFRVSTTLDKGSKGTG